MTWTVAQRVSTVMWAATIVGVLSYAAWDLAEWWGILTATWAIALCVFTLVAAVEMDV